MKAKEFILTDKTNIEEADLSVKGPKIITPIEGDKVEIKFGFNDYYDTHVTRGEILRIRPDGVAQVMIDRTAKSEYFPLKYLKVIGPRGHVPGPKDPTYGTPANPELTGISMKPKKEDVGATRGAVVFLQGKLRRSYTDQQLKDMGAYLQNNKWVMPREKYKDLVQKGVLESSKLAELSPSTLASYKKKAGAAATAADKAGDYDKGHKRFKGIVQATNKEFDKSAKKGVAEEKKSSYNYSAGMPSPEELEIVPPHLRNNDPYMMRQFVNRYQQKAKQQEFDRARIAAGKAADAEREAAIPVEKLEAELKQLQAQVDPHAGRSDDYSFYKKQQAIVDKIESLKQRIAKKRQQ